MHEPESLSLISFLSFSLSVVQRQHYACRFKSRAHIRLQSKHHPLFFFFARFHFIILSDFSQNFILQIFPLPWSISISLSYNSQTDLLQSFFFFLFYPSPSCEAEELPFFFSSHLPIHLYQDTSPFVPSQGCTGCHCRLFRVLFFSAIHHPNPPISTPILHLLSDGETGRLINSSLLPPSPSHFPSQMGVLLR